MKKIKIVGILLISILVFNSCKETQDISPNSTYLVSYTLVNEVSKDKLIESLSPLMGTQASLFVRSGVKQYKIIYQTTNTDGTSIQASGAMIVPDNAKAALSLISYQHGTISDESLAPSNFSAAGEGTIASLIATLGYIVIAPDYIGYGVSKQLPHPYEHRLGLAKPCYDFIKAFQELSKKESLAQWNQKTYLTGYSEGGYATLSLQKLIEEDASKSINLSAVTCGAGAYNKTATFKYFIENPSVGEPQHNASYIWVLQTYNRIYGLNKPMNYYFKEPFASQIEQNNSAISGDFRGLLTDAFKDKITNNSDIELSKAIGDNDVYDWKPQTPTQLYHGTSDTYVPYLNANTALSAMKKRGGNVSLISIEKGTHSSSIQSYLLGTFTFFNNY